MNKEIRVWDPLVRLFHWGLVVTFFIAYFTGEEESDLHIYSGYIVLGLISFRLIWGFIGTKHARFGDFLTTPTAAITYLKGLADKPKRYIGHNPVGGWMIVIMLITLFVVSWSGLKVYAIEEGLGPLAGGIPQLAIINTTYADDEEDFWEEFWEEIHEISSNFMLLLIALHVTGVFISSRLHNENLAKAMLTGKKEIDT